MAKLDWDRVARDERALRNGRIGIMDGLGAFGSLKSAWRRSGASEPWVQPNLYSPGFVVLLPRRGLSDDLQRWHLTLRQSSGEREHEVPGGAERILSFPAKPQAPWLLRIEFGHPLEHLSLIAERDTFYPDPYDVQFQSQ